MKEPISEFEEAQRMMQIPPVPKPSTTHHPFSDEATVIVKQDVTKEERKAKRDAINKHRYTSAKAARVRKISLAQYEKQAREQDARITGQGFGT